MPVKAAIPISRAMYEDFRIPFILSSIISGFPIKTFKSNRGWSVQYSKKYFYINLIRVQLTVIWSTWGKMLINTKLNDQLTIADIIPYVLEFLFTFNYIIGSLTPYLCYSSFQKYVRSVHKIDSVLPVAVGTKDRKRCFRQIGALLIFCLVICTFDIITVAIMHERSDKSDLNVWTYISLQAPTSFYYFFTMFATLNACYPINLITWRLRKLNTMILKHYLWSEPPTEVNIYLNNARLNAVRPNLQSIYGLFYEASSSANSYNGISLTILICVLLVQLIVIAYTLLRFFLLDEFNRVTAVLYSCWLVLHCFRVAYLVESCNENTQEVKKFSALAFQLLSNYSHDDMCNQSGILNFQLIKLPIEYKPMGLVKIERKLITAITGFVLTYLIILYQFSTKVP